MAYPFEKYIDPLRRQRRAISAVANAVKRGKLRRLDGSVPCVDCGAPAQHYEHRDYKKPLKVQPVCCRCNLARGPGMHGPAWVPPTWTLKSIESRWPDPPPPGPIRPVWILRGWKPGNRYPNDPDRVRRRAL